MPWTTVELLCTPCNHTDCDIAAKQEAFEEAAKLKHQFRSLDEDDVSFLNGIRQAEEAKQREVEKQTLDQLQAFRKQQEESGAVPDLDPTTTDSQASPAEETLTWTAPAKKRKREAARGLKGVKVAKTTASTDEEVPTPKTEIVSPGANKAAAGAQTKDSEAPLEDRKAENDRSAQSVPSATTKAGPMLGLGDYSSDDD